MESAMLEPVIENGDLKVEMGMGKDGSSDAITSGNDDAGKAACEHNGFIPYVYRSR
jgi:hypothetical protein